MRKSSLCRLDRCCLTASGPIAGLDVIEAERLPLCLLLLLLLLLLPPLLPTSRVYPPIDFHMALVPCLELLKEEYHSDITAVTFFPSVPRLSVSHILSAGMLWVRSHLGDSDTAAPIGLPPCRPEIEKRGLH
ncbi:uncharacterized protein BO95DRAFT_154602 [Aspergillus brunneoviolaceus CBS 621.78]|uniref:Uncharacterized protein n=1 Tax=Aspergillus brunneoviolaceus CBS 621.78 TaxID=1450534 RepID=A0ACD1G778_9EURO|nr:hypothetical protein BO95DRAFT_154602 [Aspergillus brunneoviolaceus CBS 621.78]RAH45098.1 hypothetical protein BO95DRAFT_154602 [Aspergillus brunneoviolaceus CBS 621.78]